MAVSSEQEQPQPPEPTQVTETPIEAAVEAMAEAVVETDVEAVVDTAAVAEEVPAVEPPLVVTAELPQPVSIPMAMPAPLANAPQQPPSTSGLPLQLLNQLLARLGAAPLQSLADLLPALRLISVLVVAGITIKLTGATLGAINELPLIGRLLELVGLISALQFLATNALRSQKRAELLARIQKLRQDFLG